tara:strand:- start:104342 stop:104770 length:429 start_codon:yes stop_codon:yes gene_type:complete
MKRGLYFILALVILFPAFTQWMPHDSIHAVQQHFSEHHAKSDDNHIHHNHDHTENQTHPLQLDIVSYYNDYLHVDLTVTDNSNTQVNIKKSPDHNNGFVLATISETHRILTSNSVDVALPPDMGQYLPYNLPLYLSTQRFRL